MNLYQHMTRARLAHLLKAGAFGQDAARVDVDKFLGGDDYHTAMIGACLGQLVDALAQVPTRQGEAA